MISDRMTQVRKMLAYAKANGSITNFDAVYNLGILSPTRRVCDIRKLGYRVEKTRERIVDSEGVGKHIIRYRFIKEEAV